MGKKKEGREGFCPQCRYREVGNYCWKCGSFLIDISNWGMKCECGKLIYPWVWHCQNCGRINSMDNIILYVEAKDGEAQND